MPGKFDPWVNGQTIPGVTLPYNALVQVISGAHRGERGWLVGVDVSGTEPVYTIEVSSRGPDLFIPQSELVSHHALSESEYVSLRLHALPTSESGRKSPFSGRSHNGASYKPHLRLSPGSEYLGVAFIDGPDWIYPGDTVETTVALIYTSTGVDYSPLVVGTSVEVVEGTHVVARGEVLRRWSEPGDWRSRESA
jgi:hypothetical protein